MAGLHDLSIHQREQDLLLNDDSIAICIYLEPSYALLQSIVSLRTKYVVPVEPFYLVRWLLAVLLLLDRDGDG